MRLDRFPGHDRRPESCAGGHRHDQKLFGPIVDLVGLFRSIRTLRVDFQLGFGEADPRADRLDGLAISRVVGQLRRLGVPLHLISGQDVFAKQLGQANPRLLLGANGFNFARFVERHFVAARRFDRDQPLFGAARFDDRNWRLL